VSQPEALRQAIVGRLSTVIDPETGADVIRMRLVENLEVDPTGHVTYTFRPSSPLCPIAVFLAQMIQQAVSEVEGVMGQTIAVEGYVLADRLTALLNAEGSGSSQSGEQGEK
jgi:metal-sulfur cluster biosynthetic enzyme